LSQKLLLNLGGSLSCPVDARTATVGSMLVRAMLFRLEATGVMQPIVPAARVHWQGNVEPIDTAHHRWVAKRKLSKIKKGK